MIFFLNKRTQLINDKEIKISMGQERKEVRLGKKLTHSYYYLTCDNVSVGIQDVQ